MYTVHQGDNLDILKTMPDNTFTAVVTDPPAGISFMGKDWDHHKGGMNDWVDWMTEVMTECLRVTKPGGYLLCWALPRTSHWTGQAIEQAGWEINTVVTHLFGTGFPKGQDIGKAIDKKQGNERKVIGQYQHPDGKPRHVENHANNKTVRVSDHNWGMTQSGFQPITAPVSDEAKLWDGYKTQLKPAVEFWWLAQKPVEGTYAQNCLKYGCGALNIDECRIPAIGYTKGGQNKSVAFGMNGLSDKQPRCDGSHGRYPSNLILSDHQCVLDQFPNTKSGKMKGGTVRTKGNHIYDMGKDMVGRVASVGDTYGDEGSAARFFYCAKASPSDRGKYNNHPTVKSTALMEYLIKLVKQPEVNLILDPFAGSGSTLVAAEQLGLDSVGIEMNEEYIEIIKKRLGEN